MPFMPEWTITLVCTLLVYRAPASSNLHSSLLSWPWKHFLSTVIAFDIFENNLDNCTENNSELEIIIYIQKRGEIKRFNELKFNDIRSIRTLEKGNNCALGNVIKIHIRSLKKLNDVWRREKREGRIRAFL